MPGHFRLLDLARRAAPALGFLAAIAAVPALADTPACNGKPGAMGTARTIEVDTTGGADFGTMQYRSTLPLRPKEIVFTFDDGPNPEHTPKILDVLDRHCIKATFFVVGRYAELHPEIVRDAWARGHTIATHTWSHPILSRMSYKASVRQIDRGIGATRAALAGLEDLEGRPARVAPFFRFPGLNHTSRLRRYLAANDIATFSCDMGTDDWRRISPWTLYKRALRMIEYKGSGIVIFHDTHHRTSTMLEKILDELARRGYQAVHMVPRGHDGPAQPELAASTIGATPSSPQLSATDGQPVTDTSPTLRPSVAN